jgi:hypothetical protein
MKPTTSGMVAIWQGLKTILRIPQIKELNNASHQDA